MFYISGIVINIHTLNAFYSLLRVTTKRNTQEGFSFAEKCHLSPLDGGKISVVRNSATPRCGGLHLMHLNSVFRIKAATRCRTRITVIPSKPNERSERHRAVEPVPEVHELNSLQEWWRWCNGVQRRAEAVFDYRHASVIQHLNTTYPPLFAHCELLTFFDNENILETLWLSVRQSSFPIEFPCGFHLFNV